MAGALRGHRRAGTVWHGAKARLGSMFDPCERPRVPARAADAFGLRAPKLQRRCQMNDERKS